MTAACSYTSSAVALLAAPLALGAVALSVGAFLVPKRSRIIAGGILLVLAIAQAAIYIAAVFVFTRVDLTVDEHDISMSFGLGALRETLPRDQLESARSNVEIPHGLGLRIEKDYIAYWLGGTRGVRLQFANGNLYEVSCSDPAPVLQALRAH